MLPAAASTMARNRASRSLGGSCPRAGTSPCGCCARRSSTALRRGASWPLTPSERRIDAKMRSRAVIGSRSVASQIQISAWNSSFEVSTCGTVTLCSPNKGLFGFRFTALATYPILYTYLTAVKFTWNRAPTEIVLQKC
jgi:hypothetical protein